MQQYQPIPSIFLHLLKLYTQKAQKLSQIFAQIITSGLTTTTLTWNSLIRAYSKSSSPIKSILIYNHFMSSTSLSPDNHTYPALLKACSCLHSLSKGKEIHAHVIKTGLHSDLYLQNSLIHMYGILAQLKDSRRVFDSMPVRAIESWNSIIQAYRASPFLRIEAVVLFKKMLGDGFELDEITLLLVISACDQLGGIGYGSMIHVYVLKKGFRSNLKVSNGILGLYSKISDMDNASQLFAEMSARDVVSSTVMLNGYVKLGLVELAREFFDEVVDKDLVLWNSIIGGYVKANRPQEALELFAKMDLDGVAPDETTIVILLSACSSSSNLQMGRSIHRYLNRSNIEMDVFIGSALVDMYAKCGSLEEAVFTFYKLRYKDIYTWTTLVLGLGNYGHGKEALSIFLQMQREGLQPNDATFVAVLIACSRSGLVDEGLYWFDQMVKVYKISPKMKQLGCIIDLLSRAGLLSQAKEMIRTTVPTEEKTIAYKALLSACINYGDIGVGEQVARELIKLGSQSHGIYVLLSNFYAQAGRWDDVEETRRIMQELHIRKDIAISCLDTGESMSSVQKFQH